MEQIYENALAYELIKRNLQIQRQYPITVYYENTMVGKYFADIFVEDKIILELKTAEVISKAHERQLLNYLKATNTKLGLLLNFGEQAKYRRIVT